MATVGLLYLIVLGALQAFARSVERRSAIYPYTVDSFRYLVPTLWPTGGDRWMLLTGPSSARESFRVEVFADAFPRSPVRQGGLSLGTLSDVMASLEFLERAYGPGAVPSALVLGLSPRFLADIPEQRFFGPTLVKYSASFRPPGTDPDGFGLVRKGTLEGLAGRLRFLTLRQEERYRSVIAWRVATAVGPEASQRLSASALSRVLQRTGVADLLGATQWLELGPYQYAANAVDPYKWADLDPLPDATIQVLADSSSFWGKAYRWDPAQDTAARRRVAELLDYTSRRRISIFVVSLPERELSRRWYMPGFEARYRALVDSAFGAVPLLDVRCLLPEADFYDNEHPLREGATRVSQVVIAFMNGRRDGLDGGQCPTDG